MKRLAFALWVIGWLWLGGIALQHVLQGTECLWRCPGCRP